MMANTALRRLVHALVMGDALGLAARLAPAAIVHDPAAGAVGAGELGDLAAQWRDYGGALDPRWVRVTSASVRAVAEFEIDVRAGGERRPLPVAVVAEPGDADTFSAVRIYHSFWPLDGSHRVRQPVIACGGVELPADVIARYQHSLRTGDLEDILACFAEGALAREPAGGEWTYRGATRLREFYSAILASGGIELAHCTLTDDGVAAAIEYVAEKWAGQHLQPQAGVAVYERGSSGLLCAARIYDDVDPPL